jgi:hypothetical protein
MEKLFETIFQKACDNGGIATWFIIFWLAVVLVVYALKKNGLITFGSQPGRRRCDKFCEDHKALKQSIDDESKSTDSDLIEIKKMIGGMEEKMGHGFNELYALMREYSRSLNDHMGYCRGVQAGKK